MYLFQVLFDYHVLCGIGNRPSIVLNSQLIAGGVFVNINSPLALLASLGLFLFLFEEYFEIGNIPHIFEEVLFLLEVALDDDNGLSLVLDIEPTPCQQALRNTILQLVENLPSGGDVICFEGH